MRKLRMLWARLKGQAAQKREDAAFDEEIRKLLLERFDLTDAADRTARTYSGGMRRRVSIAVAGVSWIAVTFTIPSSRYQWRTARCLSPERRSRCLRDGQWR